jgi:hypothetical protein
MAASNRRPNQLPGPCTHAQPTQAVNPITCPLGKPGLTYRSSQKAPANPPTKAFAVTAPVAQGISIPEGLSLTTDAYRERGHERSIPMPASPSVVERLPACSRADE